jgi:ribosomal protein S18 acetylase RimI-like enzyme
MNRATEPVRLAPAQIRQAGEVLGRAFHDDPANVHVIPSEATRRQVLPRFMGVATQLGHQYGEVYTTAGTVDGAAVWLPPHDAWTGPLRMVGRWMLAAALFGEVGLLAAPIRIGLTGMRRFLAISNLFEKLHQRDVPPQHWYLSVLGVEPERQGQGVGGSLIQPVLKTADTEGLPCYLETTRDRNVPFYRRHGFEVVVDGSLPDGGPPFWTMTREARQR